MFECSCVFASIGCSTFCIFAFAFDSYVLFSLTAESFREFAGLLQDVEEGRMMLVGGMNSFQCHFKIVNDNPSSYASNVYASQICQSLTIDSRD